jgi:sigma-B regulation protein RsbU (phosphoserine phosphatase)
MATSVFSSLSCIVNWKVKKMRILAVDDDPIILSLLEEYLSMDGSHVLDVHLSAESAFSTLNTVKNQYDCIILDIMLPGMDGIEFCEQLRKTKRHKAVPIIMITGSNEVNLMARAFTAGATDFITKPMNRLELATRVKSAGMLNHSLAHAHHLMSELTQLMKIRFDEPIVLGVEGIFDVLALENDLLRCETERFAMTLINLEFCTLRGVYRSVNSSAFRHCLEIIGTTAAWSMREKNAKLAYVGKGRFVGTVLDRRRIDCDVLTTCFNAKLAAEWNAEKTGILLPPQGRFSKISTQRMWSGASAGGKLRDFLTNDDGFGNLSRNEESDLFSRLDQKFIQIN